MKLGQIEWNSRLTAAVFDGECARPIPGHTLMDLIERSEREGATLPEWIGRYASLPRESHAPAIPIQPAEVWACGCTYDVSASFRDAEHGTREGFYRHVFESERPEIFFKGTARVCVGPDKPIGLREDSKFTAPEPELAVLLGSRGKILGYTVANDVSAWDIERENPLYLPQSKVYTGCCSLGPWFVTPEELGDPYALQMTCRIQRGGKTIFDGATSTAKLGRKIEQLIEFLLRANPVPSGSVLLTGTGIIVTQESALAAGDVVEIEVPQIGKLSNTVEVV